MITFLRILSQLSLYLNGEDISVFFFFAYKHWISAYG